MFFALVLFALSINAVPAKPGMKRTLTLANGTTVQATLVGDEHGHFYVDANGKAYNRASGKAFYQEVNSGNIISKAKARRTQVNAKRVKRLGAAKVGEVGSYTGQKKGIVILVNYTDVKWQSSNTLALFKRIANEENFSYGSFKGSMYDYFKAQSGGQFELTFDVVGPVTVANKQSYYGGNDDYGNDEHAAEMVIEACKLADSQVNFSNYDWDGDGYVDQVYVVYAGQGEADGGSDDTIWPHAYDLESANEDGDGSGVLTLDGVKINTYACGSELNGSSELEGIGTMCHEFSHCLGYPDFYDIDYSGGQGMYSWDLMDMGSYNDDGYQPAGYTSYERWMAGWQEPIELTSTTAVTGMKGLQDGGESYVIYNDNNRNEYFLLENRTQTGWDASLPGGGMLIIHVDYDATVWSNNQPNDDASHQRMTWVPADGNYNASIQTSGSTKYVTISDANLAKDLWPQSGKTVFGPQSTGNTLSKLWTVNSEGSNYLNVSVEDITKDANGLISFNFQGLSSVATPTFTPAAGRYNAAQNVTISCATDGAEIYYTLDGTKPSTSSAKYTAAITVAETTTVKAVAVKDGEESAVATAKYTITDGNQLFYEGLSKYTSDSDGTAAIETTEEDLDFDGWTTLTKVYKGGTSNAYAEGGCLKLGSSKAIGSMSATGIALTGSGTLTFYLKKYGNDTGKLNVTVTGATADVTQFTPSSDWTLCTVSLTGATGNVGITLATSAKRAYVDEIELLASSSTTPVETVADPVITADKSEFEAGETVNVTFSHAQLGEGGVIYYTTDGNDPTTASAMLDDPYDNVIPFQFTATTTVKAIAMNGTAKSKVVSKVITLKATASDDDVVLTLPYENTLLSTTIPENFTTSGDANVWTCTSNYGAKATAGSKVAKEAYFITPLFDMTHASAPKMKFSHTGRYFGTPANEATLWAREKGGAWQQVTIPNYFSNSNWTYVDTEIDLSAFVGKTVQFGFRYTSSTSAYGTWEIKNLSIADGEIVINYQDETIESLNGKTGASIDNINLKLNNAQVVYVDATQGAYVREGNYAIQFFKTGLNLTAGQVMTGSIKFNYSPYYGVPEVKDIDGVTNLDDVTFGTATTPEATTVTMAELLALNSVADFVTLNNVTIEYQAASSSVAAEGPQRASSDVYYAVEGSNKVQLYDKFNTGLLVSSLNGQTVNIEGIFGAIYNNAPEIFPTKIQDSATGIDGIHADNTTATGAIYSLDGRRVYGQLQRGIYVRNGKKFVVK